MKRYLALLLAVLMLFMTACQKTDTKSVKPDGSSDTASVSQGSDTESSENLSSSAPSTPSSSVGGGNSTPAVSVKLPDDEVIATPSEPVKPAPIPVQPELKPEDIVPPANTEPPKPEASNQVHTALASSQYYQYSQMSADEKKIYGALKTAAETYQNYVDITHLGVNINKEDALNLMQKFRADFPQYFWISNYVSVSYDPRNNETSTCVFFFTDGTVTDNLENKTADRAKIAQKRIQVEAAIKDIVSKIGVSWTEYEKEKYIHDYVAASMKYDTDSANNPYIDDTLKPAYDIYGALINKKGVCEAYSKTFQVLCYAVGINANQVMGVGHMWNIVKLGGDWYEVDVTWDDPIVNGGAIDIIRYNYFNITSAQMLADHTLDTTLHFAKPNCTATRYAYSAS